jgi:hypothetical protein
MRQKDIMMFIVFGLVVIGLSIWVVYDVFTEFYILYPY